MAFAFLGTLKNMKKIVLLTILSAILCLGGTVGSAYGQGYKWSGWQPDPCFSGLQFRTRRDTSMSSVEGNGKYYWYAQYRNNYQKRIAFDYVVMGQSEEVVRYVKTYGGQYRTELKPGQIDQAVGHTLTSPEKIWEVIGHVRILEGDSLDLGPSPFETCDSGGNRGQIDYICRNEPNPQFDCLNHVKSKPSEKPLLPLTRGRASTAPANAEECLSLYQTISNNKKSENLASLEEAIDAADEFRSRCKLTIDQQGFIDKELSQIRNWTEQLNRRYRGSTATEMLTGSAAKPADPTLEAKNAYIEFLQQHKRFGASNVMTNVQFSVSDDGRFRLDYDKNAEHITCQMEFRWIAPSKWGGSGGGSTITLWQQMDDDFGLMLNAQPVQCGEADVVTVDLLTKADNDEESRLWQAVRSALKNPSSRVAEKEMPDEMLPTQPATPLRVADYEQTVLSEAKAAGKLPPGAKSTAIPPKSPPLTPKQRAALNSEAQKKLSDMIQKDIDESAKVGEETMSVSVEAQTSQTKTSDAAAKVKSSTTQSATAACGGNRECLLKIFDENKDGPTKASYKAALAAAFSLRNIATALRDGETVTFYTEQIRVLQAKITTVP